MVQVVEHLTLTADGMVPVVQTIFHELANQLDFNTNFFCILRVTLENALLHVPQTEVDFTVYWSRWITMEGGRPVLEKNAAGGAELAEDSAQATDAVKYLKENDIFIANIRA